LVNIVEGGMPGDHGIWKRAPIPKGIAKLR